MEWDWLTLDGVHWGAVALAFVANFAVGWWWYSKAGFFGLWTRLEKLTEEDMKKTNVGVAFGGMIVATALGVVLLAILMAVTGATTPASGAALGGILGLVYRAGAHAIHNGFAARHPGLTLLDGAHDTVGLIIAGAVLGAF